MSQPIDPGSLQAQVKAMAEREFREEEFRAAVEREKERLRLRKAFWVRAFPWRLKIERRDQLKPFHVCAQCRRSFHMNEALGVK